MKTLLFLPLLTLCGCMALSVPQTRLTGTIAGQPFSLATPKDSELRDLVIQVRGSDSFGGTNYTAITIGSLKANMNPAVITTTAEAQQQMIEAVGAQVGKAAAAAAK